MTETVTLRLDADLVRAIDEEAEKNRRSRSQMIRLLVDDALTIRRDGLVKPSSPSTYFIERFDGPTPPFGVCYRVLRDSWNEDFTTRTIFEWEVAGGED